MRIRFLNVILPDYAIRLPSPLFDSPWKIAGENPQYQLSSEFQVKPGINSVQDAKAVFVYEGSKWIEQPEKAKELAERHNLKNVIAFVCEGRECIWSLEFPENEFEDLPDEFIQQVKKEIAARDWQTFQVTYFDPEDSNKDFRMGFSAEIQFFTEGVSIAKIRYIKDKNGIWRTTEEFEKIYG